LLDRDVGGGANNAPAKPLASALTQAIRETDAKMNNASLILWVIPPPSSGGHAFSGKLADRPHQKPGP
jgi:hypothetical protein